MDAASGEAGTARQEEVSSGGEVGAGERRGRAAEDGRRLAGGRSASARAREVRVAASEALALDASRQGRAGGGARFLRCCAAGLDGLGLGFQGWWPG